MSKGCDSVNKECKILNLNAKVAKCFLGEEHRIDSYFTLTFNCLFQTQSIPFPLSGFVLFPSGYFLCFLKRLFLFVIGFGIDGSIYLSWERRKSTHVCKRFQHKMLVAAIISLLDVHASRFIVGRKKKKKKPISMIKKKY